MIHMNGHELQQLFPQHNTASAEFTFTSVEIDSRKNCGNALFIAIKGDNFDAHHFIHKAEEQGAVAALVETEIDGISIPQIVVDDTRKALAELATHWRNKINPTVIAITGSNGKTTVKEMLGQILKNKYQTLVTPGNFNNEIGVPLTLLRLSENDRFAVIEMGANHRSEIKVLVGIAQPDVVYVNNARSAHIEGFGSLQAVIQAKGEIYQFCDAAAIAVFNDDEDASDYWKSIASANKKLCFSAHQHSDVKGITRHQRDGLLLSVIFDQQQFDCHLQVLGDHNAQNALAAITLAIACGLSARQSCLALNGFTGVKGRQQFVTGLNNSLIINDSYNANPDSLSAAVKVLCALDGKAWLALGDMAEMGDKSLELHKQAVMDAKKAGVQQFFALGKMSCQAAACFSDKGFCFSRHDEMVNFLAKRLNKDTNLLVKGSRSAGMEKVVEKLIINNDHTQAGVEHAI